MFSLKAILASGQFLSRRRENIFITPQKANVPSKNTSSTLSSCRIFLNSSITRVLCFGITVTPCRTATRLSPAFGAMNVHYSLKIVRLFFRVCLNVRVFHSKWRMICEKLDFLSTSNDGHVWRWLEESCTFSPQQVEIHRPVSLSWQRTQVKGQNVHTMFFLSCFFTICFLKVSLGDFC